MLKVSLCADSSGDDSAAQIPVRKRTTPLTLELARDNRVSGQTFSVRPCIG